MGGNKERQRILDRIVRGNGNLGQHSLNQRAIKYERDRRRKGFGEIDKAVKVQARRERKQLFPEELEEKKRIEEEGDRISLHALSHNITEGVVVKKNVDYILRHEETVDMFKTEKGSKIIITFLYLTPPNSNNSS